MKQTPVNQFVLTAGLAAAVMTSAALAGCSLPRAAAAQGQVEEPLAVTVARVTMADMDGAIDMGGVVQARATATISARILAPVREIRVSPGDHIRAGQILIVLSGEDLAAGARAARAAALAAEQGSKAAAADSLAADAALNLARASYDRVAGLQSRGSATAQELDDATAMLRSAEARVAGASARALQAESAVDGARSAADQASAAESFTRIAAPFDGTITEKLVDPGNMASPGMPLLRLEDTGGFRLEVRVDESRIGQIRNGQSIPVFHGTGASTGTVVEISRAVDADARAFLVKIALPDAGGLRSGEFGKARLTGVARRALTVPTSAIVRHGQITSVFVVDHGVARVRLVSLSGSEVLAGLTESETVIVSPSAAVTDGRCVSLEDR